MLSIKDCKFGVFKTWKKVINYDLHVYKKENLISEDLNDENVNLIDNIDQFEKELLKYKKNLFESYKKEKNVSRRKTNKEINKEFYTSKIMRSFRISVNHIELESLHKPNDSDFQKRKNIFDFYNQVLQNFQNVLNKNNKWKQKVQIISAEIHFDQTSPHLHIHVSNLRKIYLKKLNKEVLTCNYNQSDLIRILKNKQSKLKNKIKANEIFTQYLKELNTKFDLDLINRVDLKRLYPDIYDVQLYKQRNGIKKIELNLKMKDDKLQESVEGKNWRKDKEILFSMHKENLSKLNLNISESNDITNSKKMNDIVYYCWKQSLALQTAKEQKLEFDKKQESNQVEKNIKFELDLTKINNNKYINEMLDRSMNNDELSMHIIQPLELKDMNKDCLLSNISEYCPELKVIEKELKQSLGLFKNMNLNDQLNNTNFINKIKTDNLEYIDRSKLEFSKDNKLEITNNNLDANNNLTSIEYLQANDFKKKSKSNDFELDLDDETFNKNYFIKKELEIDYSTKKQINVTDIEKQEEIEKLKRTRSLSI